MKRQRCHLLNKFLIACIFIGIVMILLKEKEGFASHYYNFDEVYKSPILDSTKKEDAPNSINKFAIKNKKGFRIRNHTNINENTNITNFRLHPCNDNGFYSETCNEFYKPNDVVIGPKQKSCRPGFKCTRVGFYCSLID